MLTQFGEWFYNEQEEYNQSEFADIAGVSRVTIITACNQRGWIPSQTVMKKIMDAVKMVDPNKRASHFWDY
jgi:DNA-binding XRE family transcriptional regulator